MASVQHAPIFATPKSYNMQNRVQIVTWGNPVAINNPSYPTRADGVQVPTEPSYTALATTDTCTPARLPHVADKSVQITGTAGSGGSITLQGSNDGTNWVTLTNVAGAALSGLLPGTINQITEETLFIQPLVVSGDGTTAMNVIVVGKAQF
jgi:hypothetical protein